MTTDLAVKPQFSLVPGSFDEAIKISKTLAASKLVPKDYQNQPENVFVAIAWGQELGLAPLQSLQNIAVINGRPAIWGDAALAIVMARPDFVDIEETVTGEGDKMVATCTVKRKGRSPVTRTFTAADAKRAGLWEKAGPWMQYKPRMMQLRARGFSLRDSFPDAMRGFNLVEEVQDIEEKDVTPERPAVVMPTAKVTTPDPEPVQPREVIDTETGEVIQQPTAANPEPAPVEGEPTASEGQLKVIRAKLASRVLNEADLAAAFNVPTIAAIPASKVNAALEWIKNGGAQA